MIRIAEFLALSVVTVLIAGCTSTDRPQQCALRTSLKHAERVFFKPKENAGEWITIERTNDFVEVRLGAKISRIQPDQEYYSLINTLLDSDQWQQYAIKPYASMPWSGTPRDILDVEYDEWGMRLQGSQVLDDWAAMITKFASQRTQE